MIAETDGFVVEGVHGAERWRRVAIVCHGRPPTLESARREVAYVRRDALEGGSRIAVVAVVENVFPPPARHVMGEYRKAFQQVPLGAFVVVAGEGGFAASILRSLLTGLVSIASGRSFEIVSTPRDAGEKLASEFGDGGSAAGLEAAITALRARVGSGAS